MTEQEKEQHAMEFLAWALRHESLLFSLHEACVLCVLLAKNSAFISSAMTDTVQELVCTELKSQGTKKMLENFISKIQSTNEQIKTTQKKTAV